MTTFSRIKTTRYLTGIALIFAFLTAVVLFSSPDILQRFGIFTFSAKMLVVSRLLIWIGLLGLWFYARFAERGPLVVQNEKEYHGTFYIPAILILLAVVTIGGSLLGYLLNWLFHESSSLRLTRFVLIMKGNFLLLFFVAATAGITEEIIFRGFIQTRLETIFKNHWIAIICTSLLFSVLHASYGTIPQVVIPFFIGMVFSVFYYRYRSLRILIVVHFLFDLLSLLVLVNKI